VSLIPKKSFVLQLFQKFFSGINGEENQGVWLSPDKTLLKRTWLLCWCLCLLISQMSVGMCRWR